jgi:DnaJ-class molecular chaperone
MKCKFCGGTGKIFFVFINSSRTPKLIDTKMPCGKCGGDGKRKLLPAFRANEKINDN